MGLEGGGGSVDLLIGTATHMGLERLLLGDATADALSAAEEAWDKGAGIFPGRESNPLLASQFEEGLALAKAFVLGWSAYRLPAFLAEFEILHIEKELRVPLSDSISLYARADVVVRSRADGSVWVFNHKTCSDWDALDWHFDIQMWTEALAVEWDLKEPVAGCIVEGFYKGYKRNGLFTSPLIYGYRDRRGGWHQGYTAGAEKLFIPSAMPLSEWIGQLSPDTVDTAFRRSGPIPKNDVVVDRWLKSVIRRETDIENILSPDVSEEDRLDFFYQRISKWTCRRCPFQDVCFDRATVEDLLASGRLRRRTERRTKIVDVEGTVIPGR